MCSAHIVKLYVENCRIFIIHTKKAHPKKALECALKYRIKLKPENSS